MSGTGQKEKSSVYFLVALAIIGLTLTLIIFTKKNPSAIRNNHNKNRSITLIPTNPTINPEGKFCGGFAANLPKNQCPTGYICELDGNYPDAGGKCVKE